MKLENINEVEFEAKRLLKRITDLKKNGSFNHDKTQVYVCKESAAVKRSSMDLTRSLSKMRNEIY